MSDNFRCPVCGGTDFFKDATSQLVCCICNTVLTGVSQKAEFDEFNKGYVGTNKRKTQKMSVVLTQRLSAINIQSQRKQKLMGEENDNDFSQEEETFLTTLGRVVMTYSEVMAKYYEVDVEEVMGYAKEMYGIIKNQNEDQKMSIVERLQPLKKISIHLRKYREAMEKERKKLKEDANSEVEFRVSEKSENNEAESSDKDDWFHDELLTFTQQKRIKEKGIKYCEEDYEILRQTLIDSVDDPFVKKLIEQGIDYNEVIDRVRHGIEKNKFHYSLSATKISYGTVQEKGDLIQDEIEKYKRSEIVRKSQIKYTMPLIMSYFSLIKAGKFIAPQIFYRDVVNQRLPFFSNVVIAQSFRSNHSLGSHELLSFGTNRYFSDFIYVQCKSISNLFDLRVPLLNTEETMKQYIEELHLPSGLITLSLMLYKYFECKDSIKNFIASIYLALRFSTLGWDNTKDDYFVDKYIKKYSYLPPIIPSSSTCDIELLRERGKIEQLIDICGNFAHKFVPPSKQRTYKSNLINHALNNWKRSVYGLKEIDYGDNEDGSEEFMNDVNSFNESSEEESDDSQGSGDGQRKKKKRESEDKPPLEIGHFIQDIEVNLEEKRLRPVKIKKEKQEKGRLVGKMREWFGCVVEEEKKEKMFKPLNLLIKEEVEEKKKLTIQVTKLLTVHYRSVIKTIGFEKSRKRSYIDIIKRDKEIERFNRDFEEIKTANEPFPKKFDITFTPIQTEFGVLTVEEQQKAMLSVKSLLGKELFQIGEQSQNHPFNLTSVEMIVMETFSRLLGLSFETTKHSIMKYWNRFEKDDIYPVAKIKKEDLYYLYHSKEELIRHIYE